MPGSLSLRLTPERLLVLEASDEEPTPAPQIAPRVVTAFARGTAAGLLHLGAAELDALLPVSLQFWRGVGRAFMAAVCATPDLEVARPALSIPVDFARLLELREAAPPMPGGEYLDEPLLERLWRELEAELRAQLAAFTGPAEDFLQRLAPVWNSLGRVYLHLAENKRDLAHPFAFLATYTAGFSSRDRVQHTPLGDALRTYAGQRDRAALERLLAPVRRAADRSPLVRELLETEQLFHPLAWTPAEAHRFLKELPLLDGTGLLLRLPDWWKARPRPVVQVSVGQRAPSTLGVTALLEFDVGLAVEDTPLTEAETRALLRSVGGLVLLKGRWVEVDPARIKEALDHWRTAERAARSEGIPFGEAMRLMAGVRLGEAEAASAAERERTRVGAGPWLQKALADLTRPGARPLAPRDEARGDPAPLSVGRRRVAGRAPQAATRRVPRRRHGARQDHPGHRLLAWARGAGRGGSAPAGRPRVVARELARGARAVRPFAHRARRPPVRAFERRSDPLSGSIPPPGRRRAHDLRSAPPAPPFPTLRRCDGPGSRR